MAGFPSCKKKNTPAPDKPVDVYVAGITRPPSGNTIASYWKNGTLVALSTGATPSWAYSIAVAGSDVYVVGTIVTATGNYVGVYWKNGIMTLLTDSTISSAANAVTISGNNIYISGVSTNSNGEVATCWRNGVRDTLTAGSVLSTAAYWKNGVQFNLTNSTTTGFATGITLDANNNVYVSGGAEPPTDVQPYSTVYPMLYWKNGILVHSNMTYGNNSNLDYGNIAVAGAGYAIALAPQ